MYRSLAIGAGATCLFIGAGVLFADYGNTAAQARARTTAGAPAASPVELPLADPVLRIVWPTPYPRLSRPASDTDYLQATASGNPESGGYGMVRDAGARFHEGLDIRPVARDRKGEPADDVLAALDGRVAYVNSRANGAYGKYIVLEHTPAKGLTLYSLYAHLALPDPRIREGMTVTAGTRLGLMGRTDAKGGFPRERAHLHFEIGFRLSDNFARWYAGRRYPDANSHGNFNGINLAGLDPADFFRFVREHDNAPKTSEFLAWLKSRPVTVVVETPVRGRPNFLSRNPALAADSRAAAGWRIGFTAYGTPIRWEPLAIAPPATRVVLVDGPLAVDARRRGMITTAKRGLHTPGSTLETSLALACD